MFDPNHTPVPVPVILCNGLYSFAQILKDCLEFGHLLRFRPGQLPRPEYPSDSGPRASDTKPRNWARPSPEPADILLPIAGRPYVVPIARTSPPNTTVPKDHGHWSAGLSLQHRSGRDVHRCVCRVCGCGGEPRPARVEAAVGGPSKLSGCPEGGHSPHPGGRDGHSPPEVQPRGYLPDNLHPHGHDGVYGSADHQCPAGWGLRAGCPDQP